MSVGKTMTEKSKNDALKRRKKRQVRKKLLPNKQKKDIGWFRSREFGVISTPAGLMSVLR